MFLKEKDLATAKLELQRAQENEDEEDEDDLDIVRQSRGPKRKSWEDLGIRAKRRASDACQRQILGTAAARETDPMTIASHCLYRCSLSFNTSFMKTYFLEMQTSQTS